MGGGASFLVSLPKVGLKTYPGNETRYCKARLLVLIIIIRLESPCKIYSANQKSQSVVTALCYPGDDDDDDDDDDDYCGGGWESIRRAFSPLSTPPPLPPPPSRE